VKTSNSAPHHEKARPYSLGHAVKSMCRVMHLKGGRRGCGSSVLRDLGEPTLALQAAAFWAILQFR
jgi:hypothetical protein